MNEGIGKPDEGEIVAIGKGGEFIRPKERELSEEEENALVREFLKSPEIMRIIRGLSEQDELPEQNDALKGGVN